MENGVRKHSFTLIEKEGSQLTALSRAYAMIMTTTQLHTYGNDGIVLVDRNANTEGISQMCFSIRPQWNHLVSPRYAEQRRVVEQLISKPSRLRCPHVDVQPSPVRFRLVE